MNRRSALRALGITGAGLAGAGLVGPVPSLVSPTSPGQGRCFYFATEYEEWDGWSAPGLDLPPGGGMLTVFSATDDDHPSTLSVGSEGNIHGPHVPLTPAIICAIWEGLTSRKLVTLTAAEAATWLDPVLGCSVTHPNRPGQSIARVPAFERGEAAHQGVRLKSA